MSELSDKEQLEKMVEIIYALEGDLIKLAKRVAELEEYTGVPKP